MRTRELSLTRGDSCPEFIYCVGAYSVDLEAGGLICFKALLDALYNYVYCSFEDKADVV